VILDVQMPGMDGFEVAEAISGIRKTSELPIIFLSAVNISKAFITRGYTSGGQDYLVKPVDQHGVREHRYGDLRGAEPQKTAGAPGGNTVAGRGVTGAARRAGKPECGTRGTRPETSGLRRRTQGTTGRAPANQPRSGRTEPGDPRTKRRDSGESQTAGGKLAVQNGVHGQHVARAADATELHSAPIPLPC